MPELQGSPEQNYPSSQIPRQGVFENVQTGGDISFRDLLQILLLPSREGQESERQGIRHNLPQPDYGQFVGREQELTKIFQKLRPYPHSTNSVITIDGIGGIGKSALALEVAHRFLRDYSKLPLEERFEVIVWSSAKRTTLRPDRGIVTRRQSFQTLEDICKYIAFTLAIEGQIRANPSEVVELVCRALTQQRTLLIIDNLETVDDEAVMEFLQEMLPAPTKVIVTTRHRIDVAYPMRLLGMPWKDAEQLIDQECQKKGVTITTEQKERLYRRTGGVPLAIVWTVARIGFGHRVDNVLVSLSSPQGDVAHFCFKEVVGSIKERDAYKILLALAVCKGESSREELRYVTGLDGDELSVDEGLVELEGLSLISRKGNKFMMLPLTKEYVLHELKRASQFQEQAIKRLSNYKLRSKLEMPEGTVDAESRFYVTRSVDEIALETIQRQGVTITIKGSRQVGKSSLLNRIMSGALAIDKQVVLIDFQLFDRTTLTESEQFFQQFCILLSDELGLTNQIEEFWSLPFGNTQRCTRYIQRYILKQMKSPLTLMMDEVDSIFDTDFRTDFFAMLRSWHNNRATDSVWRLLDLVLVMSTEPYQLIENLNQSPFNVGQVLELQDFTSAQVSDLNQRHGHPLALSEEKELMKLLAGHPYLIRKALYLLASKELTFADLLAQAIEDSGLFGDHLRHHLLQMNDKTELIHGFLDVIQYQTCPSELIFFRLRGAGLVRREGKKVLPRCQLYADYFREHFVD